MYLGGSQLLGSVAQPCQALSAASPSTPISHSLGRLDSPTVHLHRLNPIVGLLLSNSSKNNLVLDHSEDDYSYSMFFSSPLVPIPGYGKYSSEFCIYSSFLSR